MESVSSGEICTRHWMGEQGEAASTARKKFLRVYSCKDCRLAKTRRQYWTVGLGPIVANQHESGLLDIASYPSISSTNCEQTVQMGLAKLKQPPQQMMEDISLSHQYTEISWMISANPRRKHSRQNGQMTTQLTWSPATICHMGRLQFIGIELNGVELSGCHPIAWIVITCSGCRIMHLHLAWEIPCHMDGSMSQYFVMMDDMSPDGLWDCDEVPMDDGHYDRQ